MQSGHPGLHAPDHGLQLKDAPALIEHVFPTQRISAEAMREQSSARGKTLTSLGSYWKGRKPLVLNKAIILASLLPATDDLRNDLAVFEALMGIDDDGIRRRGGDASFGPDGRGTAVYSDMVRQADRAERTPALFDGTQLFDTLWPRVNSHLGTSASSFPELIAQLGIMRFGRIPTFLDAFCGSGQIAFEAARLGLETHASDLSPVAGMLTWGAFNVVGAGHTERRRLRHAAQKLVAAVQADINALGVERDGDGWTARTYLYCLEVRCPESGWMVPLLPSRVVSRAQNVIVVLEPNVAERRYEIHVRRGVDSAALQRAARGTVGSVGRRGGETFIEHSPDGRTEYRVPFARIRDGVPGGAGRLQGGVRAWTDRDLAPRAGDALQERLYVVVWQRNGASSGRPHTEFRDALTDDARREAAVVAYVQEHLAEWQECGFVPSMRIEPGSMTRLLIRGRGWTHWHHLFNPRQLLVLGLTFKHASTSPEYARLVFGLSQAMASNSRLSPWNATTSAVTSTFYNPVLNPLFTYGTRAFSLVQPYLLTEHGSETSVRGATIRVCPAVDVTTVADVTVTDPPLGGAVNYEELYEYFIAWLQTNPPPEFADWTWDSRRALAIRGDDHRFTLAMIESYEHLARRMSANGIHVLMFTHRSGALWARIAKIVWATGLRVTAVWYVATETDSVLRAGSYVRGTVLVVLRKRHGDLATYQDDLAHEIEREVEDHVKRLSALNRTVREHSGRTENTLSDADLQMAGYAAALRVLTRYRMIDGKDMVAEAKRQQAEGEGTIVDELIAFAVELANAVLVPEHIEKATWERLSGIERFYVMLLEQESRGVASMDFYHQFAKAFGVREPGAVMASARSNHARLKSSVELGRGEMHAGSELGGTTLRAVLFAMQQLSSGADRDKVLTGLRENVRDYYQARGHVRALAQFLHRTLGDLRPDESEHARLVDLFVMNEGV